MLKRLGVPVLFTGLAIFSMASHAVAATLDTVVHCRVIHNFDSESYIDQNGGSHPLPGAGVDGDSVAIHTDTAVLKRFYFDRYGDKVFLPFESGPLGAVTKGQSVLTPATAGVHPGRQAIMPNGLVAPRAPMVLPAAVLPQQNEAPQQKRREENLERRQAEKNEQRSEALERQHQQDAQRKEEAVERKRTEKVEHHQEVVEEKREQKAEHHKELMEKKHEQQVEHHKEVVEKKHEQQVEHHKEAVERKQAARKQRAQEHRQMQQQKKAAEHARHKAASKPAPKPHGRHK